MNQQSTTALAPAPAPAALAQPLDLGPRTFEQALQLADYMAKSEMVPKQYRGRAGDCLIAIQWGAEIGLKPLQALQSIAAINGKPNIYGDAGKALLLSHGCIIDEDDAEVVRAKSTARCCIKRPGRPPVQRTFSLEDAKTAGLWGKEGPWRTYPYRQMAWRAFWFAARDAAADLLRGMGGIEEALDTPAERHMGMVDEVTPPASPAAPPLPAYPADGFDQKLAEWAKLIDPDAGKTASALLAKLSTKATFSEEQKARILSLKKAGPAPAASPAPATATTKAADDNSDFVDAMNAAEGAAAAEGAQ